MVIVKAPASMMVMGEHAVLYQYPALVAALNQWMTVRMICRQDQRVVIHSTLGEYDQPWSQVFPHAPFQFVLVLLNAYRHRLQSGVELWIESEFSSHIGLGSSSAVVVATLVALKQILKDQWDRATLLTEARNVVRTVQGCGSGADVAASIYGGLLRYHLCETPQMYRVTWPVRLIYVGYKTPTAEVVERVQRAALAQPLHYQAVFKKIGTCVEEACAAIGEGRLNDFERSLMLNQTLMVALGVCDGPLQSLMDYLADLPQVRVAKISGSGLGDCVLVHSDGQFELCDTLKQQGMYEIPVQFSNEGVSIVRDES